MTAATKEFPRGTSDRKLTDSSRMGLRYKPETRVSFFAELLPYMDRAALAVAVDRDLAWFDENEPAGRRGVGAGTARPALPAIGLAGDLARTWPGPRVRRHELRRHRRHRPGRRPLRPEERRAPRKVGITGYDWGSKVEEVTDGLEQHDLPDADPAGSAAAVARRRRGDGPRAERERPDAGLPATRTAPRTASPGRSP